MSQNNITTTICTATEYGSDGPYQIGIEYTVGDDRVHHVIRRPIVQQTFVGYGLTPDGVGQAIERVSHDGAMSEWRYCRAGGVAEVTEQPSNPPLLNLPDEEHGHVWGEPIDITSSESVRYFWCGREVPEDEAIEASLAYADSRPGSQYEPPPGWEDRAVERARQAGVLDRTSSHPAPAHP